MVNYPLEVSYIMATGVHQRFIPGVQDAMLIREYRLREERGYSVHVRSHRVLAASVNPLTSKLSPILLYMCKVMSNNEALLSPGPYIADHSIAN